MDSHAHALEPPPTRANAEGDWRGVVRDIRVREGVVTKRATSGRAKLLREVDWLRRARPWAPRHFPEVLAVRTGDGWAEYDMPYCPWPCFADLVVGGEVGEDDAIATTRAILDLAFREIHARRRAPAPRDFFRAQYVRKLEARVRASGGQSRAFDALCASPTLEIGGVTCRSPLALAIEVAEDEALCARLQPPHVGHFHGDFKLDNFHVVPGTDQFLLIDPRGSTATGNDDGDYLEDVAKLRTSTRGLYDLVHCGALRPTVDGRSVRFRGQAEATRAAHLLGAIDHAVLGSVSTMADALADAGFGLRLAFTTPMLLLANAPFQLAPVSPATEAVAVGLFAIGALLLEIAIREARGGSAFAHTRALQGVAQ